MRNRNFHHGMTPTEFQAHRQRNRMFFGLMLALVGTGLMLKTLGIIPRFTFELSWPIILICIGLFSGIKNRFRRNGWWIAILIGVANLCPQFMIFGQPSTHFVWPAFIILVGLAIAFRPRRDYCPAPGMSGPVNKHINTESSLNVDVTFGGRKEIVTSKDFKGGLVNVSFGGAEINFVQTEMAEQTAVLDLRVSFGGVELIVPSHWEVQNQIDPSFGSVEDDRTIQTATTSDNKKVLILRGSCSFGSVEIKSF